MTESRPRYRKLPGQRRGLISSASLWTAADHLLSVRSDRFQEHYKRFYFRDIQAIVTTKVPRFLISTRVLAAAAVLLIAILFASARLPLVANWLWLTFAVLALVWIYICAAQSCACRLYTAVSREDLPSLYRIWTARKAVAELEHQIAQVQGTFTESWAEAAEFRPLGPAETTGQVAATRLRRAMRSRTPASDLLLASLFADAATAMWNIPPKPFLTGLSVFLTALQIVTAIWIFVQHRRRILRAAMQRLAIVVLFFIGGVTYVGMFVDSLEAARTQPQQAFVMWAHPLAASIRPIYSAGLALLGIVGVVLSFKSIEPEPPPVATGQTG